MNGSNVALDTNVAVAINNNQPAAVSWVRTLIAVYLPIPVLAELLFGAANSRDVPQNRDRISQLAARCILLGTDQATAEAYATLRLTLKRLGTPIPENDLWIAALCVQHGLPLATLDTHFAGIPSLALVRP